MTTMPGTARPDLKRTLKYDAWNRLVEVRASNGKRMVECDYDGLHRRIVRRSYDKFEDALTATRHFYYNENWQCVEERVGTSTNADRQYVWHPYYIDALALTYNSTGNKHFYLHDANFNVTTATDSAGTVVERYAYTPYGEATVLNADFSLDSSNMGDGISDIGNEFLYTGRRLDPETGLYQYRHRYYHAQLGRFLNRDPAGLPGFNLQDEETEPTGLNANEGTDVITSDKSILPMGAIRSNTTTANDATRNGGQENPGYVDGFNLYGYVGQNPLSFVDPAGLDRWLVSSGSHVFLIVDVYDKNCKKIGRRELHFWPGYIAGQPSYWELPYGSGMFPYVVLNEYSSTCCADRALRSLWGQLEDDRQDNWAMNYTGVNNCWVPAFMFQAYDGSCPGKPKLKEDQPDWENCFCCFVEGTQITMADGNVKAIEDVQIGEEILAYDFDKQTRVPKKVCARDNPVRRNIIDLRFSGDKMVSSTTDHPYWVEERGWCSYDPEMTLARYEIFRRHGIGVKKIQVGDTLLLAMPSRDEQTGMLTTKVFVESIDERAPEPTQLWNLRVGDYNTDWQATKKLYDSAVAAGDFTAYHRHVSQMRSQESDPSNHNFFANGVLVHNK